MTQPRPATELTSSSQERIARLVCRWFLGHDWDITYTPHRLAVCRRCKLVVDDR